MIVCEQSGLISVHVHNNNRSPLNTQTYKKKLPRQNGKMMCEQNYSPMFIEGNYLQGIEIIKLKAKVRTSGRPPSQLGKPFKKKYKNTVSKSIDSFINLDQDL